MGALYKDERLYNMKQVCAMLSVHPNTLRQWDKQGFLKAIRIGNRRDRRWKESDIADVMYEAQIQKSILENSLKELEFLKKERESIIALWHKHIRAYSVTHKRATEQELDKG